MFIYMVIPPLSYLSLNSISPLEYVPFVSTVTGMYQIFKRHVASPEEKISALHTHSFQVLSGDKSWRSYVMLLPVLGNVILLGYDALHCKEIKNFEEILEQFELLHDQELQPLLKEIKVLYAKKSTSRLPAMKELKGQWEKVQSDVQALFEERIQQGVASDGSIEKLLFIVDEQVKSVSKKVISLKNEKYRSMVGYLRYATSYNQIRQAACAGREREVKAFIKLGNEAQVINKLKFGPNPQSKAAHEMNALLTALAENPRNINVSYNPGLCKYVVTNSNGYCLCADFQALLRNVDWKQVVPLVEEASPIWDAVTSIFYWFTKGDPRPQGPLSNEEYRALNMKYLQADYIPINRLLRGDCFSFDANGWLKNGAMYISPSQESRQVDALVKGHLLTAARAIQGLYKLPEYKCSEKYLWRGEGFQNAAQFHAEIRRRINAIGKDPEPSYGFTSTSTHHLISTFAQKGCLTLIRNTGDGKDVRKYSPFQEEEILFPPTRIQWLYHKQLADGFHLFIARQV